MKYEGIFYLICGLFLGFLIGDAFHPLNPCPPCIESKACPSEEIWVNTSFGFMHFTVGEIDEAPPYIFDKQKMDEMFNQLENELLKQRGKSL